MKNHTLPIELSYFGLTLLSFLHESHPDKVDDIDFIKIRCDSAGESYSRAIKEGLTHNQAEEIASRVLYKGLHFSRYDTLIHILSNEFSWLIEQGNLPEYALSLLSDCEIIFQKYDLDDEFAFAEEYNKLYTELTGLIDFIITRNELQ